MRIRTIRHINTLMNKFTNGRARERATKKMRQFPTKQELAGTILRASHVVNISQGRAQSTEM